MENENWKKSRKENWCVVLGKGKGTWLWSDAKRRKDEEKDKEEGRKRIEQMIDERK